MLSLVDLGFKDRTQMLLENICLSAKPGDCVGILSEDDFVQQSLIQILAGLQRPTMGTAVFDGQPLFDGPEPIRRQIAWFGLPDAYFPRLTIRENLTFFARLYDLPADELDRRLDSLVELTPQGVDILDKLPPNVSTAQRELAGFLRCALLEPKLLLVDHALQRLSESDLIPVRAYLYRCVAENHIIILFSRRWSDFEGLCTSVFELKDGQLHSAAKCPGQSFGSADDRPEQLQAASAVAVQHRCDTQVKLASQARPREQE